MQPLLLLEPGVLAWTFSFIKISFWKYIIDDGRNYSFSTFVLLSNEGCNKLSSRIWLFSSDVKVDSFWSLSWTFTKCEKCPHTFLCNSFSFFPRISCKNICHSFAEVFISEISLTIFYFVQILYLCFKTLLFCFFKKICDKLTGSYLYNNDSKMIAFDFLIHRMRKSNCMNATQNLCSCVLLKVICK